jgi:phosphoribosylamine--glycine ligase
VRFGDPEAQVVLPRLAGDLAALLAEASAGRLRSEPSFSGDAAVTVVAACEGYPAAPRTGDVIEGLDAAAALPETQVFYAGVARGPDGRLRTAGGRVLALTALGRSLTDARDGAYRAIDHLRWPGMQYRRDIAASAVEEERV